MNVEDTTPEITHADPIRSVQGVVTKPVVLADSSSDDDLPIAQIMAKKKIATSVSESAQRQKAQFTLQGVQREKFIKARAEVKGISKDEVTAWLKDVEMEAELRSMPVLDLIKEVDLEDQQLKEKIAQADAAKIKAQVEKKKER